MRKYIQILIGGKTYRFLIDEELEKRLQVSLKDKYQFDPNNNLIITDTTDPTLSYQIKQQLLSSILEQIKTYDLPSDMQGEVDDLARYIDPKTNIYASDLNKLDDILGKASEIYSHTKTNLAKADTAKEQRELVNDSVGELKETLEKSEIKLEGVSTNTSTVQDKIKELETILEEVANDDKLKEEVPIADIKEAMSRVIICSSMDDFIKQTGSDTNSYNIEDAIKNKNAKIIVPPTLKLEEVVVKVLSTCVQNKDTFTKVLTYVESRATFQTETNKAFDSLRENLNVKGLNVSNINYFGDQFLNEFINICNKTGISFETMFADYFNGYSANRKYNSPLDRFIRQFITFNGGDENTRGLLEALLVKKAISRNLISSKYNNYLQDKYRSLDVNGSGYVRFNEDQLNNFSAALRNTSSLSGSASIGAQNNIGIRGNSTLSSETKSTLNTSENLGLGFNNETVANVPNFEPQANDSKIPGTIPPKGTQPKTSNNTNLAPNEINPLNNVPNINKGNKRVLGKNTSNLAAEAGISQTLDIRADVPELALGFRRNGIFNPAMMEESDEDDDSLLEDGEGENLQNSPGPKSTLNGENNVGNNDNPDDEETPNETLEDDSKGAPNILNNLKKKAENGILAVIMKHPYVAIGIGFAAIIFLLVMIGVGTNEELNQLGYYDQACNFNETTVTVTNCYVNSEDKKEYNNITLKDYVLGATYAYTKGETYDDEVLKATMITLKTNALSYGNYNSSSKDIEVKSCSVNNNYCDINTGCSLVEEGYYSGVTTYQNITDENVTNDITAASSDYISKLETIYEEISNYIYVSTSYSSAISTLSSNNALVFNENTLSEFANVTTSTNSYQDILDSIYGGETENNSTIYKDTIFIGDSRMQGMLNSGVINDNNTVYGVGYGYNWLIGNGTFTIDKTNATSGAIEGAKTKIRDNASYNIVIWLGVNDYSYNDANTYFTKYQDLATGEFSNHEIYIVAVGPVDDSKAVYVTNEGINSFNSSLENLITSSNLSNLHYINLNYNISSYDSEGLHYSSSDYINIYNDINSNLDNNISSNKTLYNLSDYCTYYNVTENDAYWWPVGSSSPTKGNIYGGTPVSTNITSYFGPRIDPISGTTSAGHGAIDIGVAKGTPVIATKNGTVNFINTGCTEGDYDCGGTYGNYIKIDHGDGIESLYAHLSEVLVSTNSAVTRGQIIGYSGNTGRSTGPHLHFEIRLNGTRVDPLNYVSADSTRPESVGTLNVDDSGTSAAENKANTCKSLLASGYSTNAVIGIMINMNAEGAFRTTNLENCYEENQCCTINGAKYGFCVHPEIKGFGSDTLYTNGVDSGAYPRDKFVNDRAGYGLIQWTSSGRKAGLYDYAKSQNKSIGALSVQLGYLMEEIKNYPVTYKYITGNYSAYDIANNFCLDFERPSNKTTSCPTRANNYLSEYTNYVNNNCR